jgi:hypothetical protein
VVGDVVSGAGRDAVVVRRGCDVFSGLEGRHREVTRDNSTTWTEKCSAAGRVGV